MTKIYKKNKIYQTLPNYTKNYRSIPKYTKIQPHMRNPRETRSSIKKHHKTIPYQSNPGGSTLAQGSADGRNLQMLTASDAHRDTRSIPLQNNAKTTSTNKKNRLQTTTVERREICQIESH